MLHIAKLLRDMTVASCHVSQLVGHLRLTVDRKEGQSVRQTAPQAEGNKCTG